MAAKGAAAAAAVPDSEDDSVPCAAPTPQPRCLVPSGGPEVAALTPEREGGILRRHQQRRDKIQPRQVRFQLGSSKMDFEARMGGGGGSSLDQHAEPAQGDSPQPLVTVTLESALPGEGGNMLATPAPHSSLVVGAEVEAAREQGFDAWQAAEELVQRSFVARCMMDARVGEGMNIPRQHTLYQGLISLQVKEDELLSSAVQEKLSLVRPRHEVRKEHACPGTGPDLLAFYNPVEQLTEAPFLGVEGLPPLKLCLQTWDPASTFLMYRKLRQWDS